MRKEPFPIKNILDSLREDVQNGTITLSQAAEELHRAGWSNYIDEDTARKIIAEVAKNNDKVPANYEFDSTVANNLKVVNGKITVALKVAAA